jgi:hypothetical protein
MDKQWPNIKHLIHVVQVLACNLKKVALVDTTYRFEGGGGRKEGREGLVKTAGLMHGV